MKQTAVEWLQSIELERDLTLADWKQAKEMEKQMTIKLYNDYENYLEEAFKNQCGGQAVIMSFGAFYEQTYGGGEQ
jgi:hypothetical protein